MTQSAILDRLMARSRYEGECLVWKGQLSSRGYGQTAVKGHAWRVHRLAWVERHGPIPPETPWVLHRCDNPPCWADDHLFLGTPQDNVDDMMAKRRHRPGGPTAANMIKTACPQGHPYTPENTYRRPSRPGTRACQTCIDERNAASLRPPRTTAEQWLAAHLAEIGGTGLASDLISAAAQAGIARTTIFRARRKVATTKRHGFGGQCMWTLVPR
jgi:HNH endonuclease